MANNWIEKMDKKKHEQASKTGKPEWLLKYGQIYHQGALKY